MQPFVVDRLKDIRSSSFEQTNVNLLALSEGISNISVAK